MQTFLPYASFGRSARALDDKRLGKQRVEALQLLHTLRGWTAGWRNHPAACMWRGHDDALALYALVMTREWKRRGFADTVEGKLRALLPPGWCRPRALPPWLGDPAFHRSHQAALVRKDPDFYGRLFPGVDPAEPYLWPIGAAPEEDEDMPEGQIIHRLARAMSDRLGGLVVAATSPQGRFPEGAARLDGQRLDDTLAHGKHLFVAFQRGDVLHVHLGKQGTVAWHEAPIPPPLAPIRLRLATEWAACDLLAPRVCALVTPEERDALLAGLGPDPLRDDADPERVWAAFQACRRPIGAALLDQALVAGVGNVLRAEALHVVGIHPATPARDLSRGEVTRLWEALVGLMRSAVETGTIRAEGRGVYKQARCGRCGGPVDVAEIGGRTSYACLRCQPLGDRAAG